MNETRRPNPDHVAEIIRMLKRSPFLALLSLRTVDIGAGFVRMEIDLEEKHRQLQGVVHGGVFAALIDTAAFWAVYFDLPEPNTWLISLDLKLNYLKSAAEGTIIARGRSLKAGRKICYADVTVTDETGARLAHGASTLMVIPVRRQLAGIFPKSPKFR